MLSPFKKEFEYFLTLCRTLNISHAAEEVGIQQAGLSKTLKQLEQNIGQALFYRTHRGLKLTPFGEKLKQNLSTTQKSWLREIEDNESIEKEKLGRFRLGMHTSLAMRFANNFFSSLCEEYPGLFVELVLDRSADVVKSVVNFETDFGIVANPIRHSDLIIKELGTGQIAAWSRFPKNHAKVLYYNADMIEIARILKSFEKYKLIPVSSYDVIANLLENSRGVGIIPSSVAQRFPRLKKLSNIMERVSINLIHRYDIPKSTAFNLIKNKIIKHVCPS